MPVQVELMDGSEYTAQRSFHAFDGSGAPRDLPYDVRHALDKAGVPLSEVEGGETLIIVDGRLVYNGFNYPRSVVGWSQRGERLDATLDILNFSRTAHDRFEVMNMGRAGKYGNEYRTTVDGQVVEEGEMRPFQIIWEGDEPAAVGFGGFNEWNMTGAPRGGDFL